MKLVPITAIALLLAPAAMAAEINVTVSEDFQTKLQDDYGTREGEYLSKEIKEDLTRELKKAGVDVARIDVTIIDARPSKPTFKQLGDEPGLDYGASRSTGGMKLSATAYDADGNEGRRVRVFLGTKPTSARPASRPGMMPTRRPTGLPGTSRKT
jgi:hypothetical protein